MFLGFEEKVRLRLEVWEWNKLNAMDFIGCTHLDQLYSDVRKGKLVDVWRPLTCKGVKINVTIHVILQLKSNYVPSEQYDLPSTPLMLAESNLQSSKMPPMFSSPSRLPIRNYWAPQLHPAKALQQKVQNFKLFVTLKTLDFLRFKATLHLW